MLIRAGYNLAFECPSATPMLLLINVVPDREPDLRSPVAVQFHSTSGQAVPWRMYRDGFNNVVTRIVAPPGRLTISADFLVQDSGLHDPVVPDAVQHPVDELPDEVLVFLLGSRYCETDKLSNLAWSLFGQTKPGWERVQAIVDYAHRRIQFGYQYARATKTAWEAHEERQGVCRDFTHLAVTLCRCMNIPARYVTGYLGDIGVPPVPDPMDFSAWFEVYLSGRWHTFDARHNKPRIGRILMARGRDATDVAISTSFGTAWLAQFDVITEEVPGG